MRERRSRRTGPPDPLARLFLEVSGGPPDDASLLRMRRVSAALNLRDNDALWSVLAVLEYYTRLYEAIPERIRQAGTGGVDAARAEAYAATQALMTQHREALARCKETITLAQEMTAEHEARYRAALAALSDEALTGLTRRATNRIALVAGNRLVGAMAVAAREQQKRIDGALASFERVVMRRLRRACYGLVACGLIAILVAASAGGLAGWWAGSHRARADGAPSSRMGHTSPVSPSMNETASRSMREAASFGSKAIIGAR
ncbi:MAG: hypothetical protein V4793_24310 [Paraburkholderia tropica]|uniref:hypothetical protein n=1 Tax=Paraburkholderia TaxID=1822464 RepID=UPI001981ADE4|nr:MULTISPECIES: hypothetical protein [Paraburkholderia]MBN3809882.1 hypothetical protein [Paraburkholderia sp. Ac-20347]